MKKDLKVASVQFEHVNGNPDANIKKVEGFVRKASRQGVDLIAFPECCISGYWFLRKAPGNLIESLSEKIPDGRCFNVLMGLSKTHSMTIGAGLIEKASDGTLYNTYLVAMPDGTFKTHRKLHCFISEHIGSGSEFTVFDTPHGWRVGVLICYDNIIIENCRVNALKGAEILLAPHQIGGCKTPSENIMGVIDRSIWDRRKSSPELIEKEFKGSKGREFLLRWLPARALDNGMFVIFSNGVGVDDDEVRTGNVMIIDCFGRVLAETWKADDDMVVSTLKASLLERTGGARWIKTRRLELLSPLLEKNGEQVDTRKSRFDY